MAILPLNEKESVVSYCQQLTKNLTNTNFRVKIFSEKSLNYRIREIYNKKIPYYIVIGKEELEKKTLKLIYTYSPNEVSELSEKELFTKLEEEKNII